MTTETSDDICKCGHIRGEHDTIREETESREDCRQCDCSAFYRAPAIQNPTREEVTEAWLKSQAYHNDN